MAVVLKTTSKVPDNSEVSPSTSSSSASVSSSSSASASYSASSLSSSPARDWSSLRLTTPVPSVFYPTIAPTAPAAPFVYEPPYLAAASASSSSSLPATAPQVLEKVFVEPEIAADEVLNPMTIINKKTGAAKGPIETKEEAKPVDNTYDALRGTLDDSIISLGSVSTENSFEGFHPYVFNSDNLLSNAISKFAAQFKQHTKGLTFLKKIQYAKDLSSDCVKLLAASGISDSRRAQLRVLMCLGIRYQIGTQLLTEVLAQPARAQNKLEDLGLVYELITSNNTFLFPKELFDQYIDLNTGIPDLVRTLALSFKPQFPTDKAIQDAQQLIDRTVAKLPQDSLYTSIVKVTLKDTLAKKILLTIGNANKESYLKTGQLRVDVEVDLGKMIGWLAPQHDKEATLIQVNPHACQPIVLLLKVIFEDLATAAEKAVAAAKAAQQTINDQRSQEYRIGKAVKFMFRKPEKQVRAEVELVQTRKMHSIAWGEKQSKEQTQIVPYQPLLDSIVPKKLKAFSAPEQQPLALEPLSLSAKAASSEQQTLALTPLPSSTPVVEAPKPLNLAPLTLLSPVIIAPQASSHASPPPLSSYLQLAFPHLIHQTGEQIWNSFSDSVKKDALNHIKIHKFLIDQDPELFTLESRIHEWMKSKHGESFYLKTKAEIDKLTPKVEDGRELSSVKRERGEEILNHYYQGNPSQSDYHARLLTLLAQFPKDEIHDLFYYFYEQARQSGWKEFGDSWGEKHYINPLFYLLTIQALERYLHTKK